MFLQGMRQVKIYAPAAMQLMHDMEQQPTTSPLPHKLAFPHVSLTMASHHAATQLETTQLTDPTTAHLNVTRADRTGNGNRGGGHTQRGPPGRGRPMGMRTPQKDIQCPACQTYGHDTT